MLGTRFQEHTDGKHPNSAIAELTSSSGHRYTLDDTKILVREDNWFLRKIRKALHIHKRSPALSRDHKIPPILLQLLLHDPQVMYQPLYHRKRMCNMDETSGYVSILFLSDKFIGTSQACQIYSDKVLTR